MMLPRQRPARPSIGEPPCHSSRPFRQRRPQAPRRRQTRSGRNGGANRPQPTIASRRLQRFVHGRSSQRPGGTMRRSMAAQSTRRCSPTSDETPSLYCEASTISIGIGRGPAPRLRIARIRCGFQTSAVAGSSGPRRGEARTLPRGMQTDRQEWRSRFRRAALSAVASAATRSGRDVRLRAKAPAALSGAAPDARLTSRPDRFAKARGDDPQVHQKRTCARRRRRACAEAANTPSGRGS